MLKFLFIGNADKSSEIASYSIVKDGSTYKLNEEAIKVFKKHISKTDIPKSQKVREKSSGGCFFYMTDNNGIFFLIFTEANYSEELAFDFISEVQQQNLHTLAQNKEFSESGVQSLRKVLTKFEVSETTEGTEEKSKISIAQNEVEAVKVDMKNNIKQAILNIEEANVIEEKSSKIKDTSEEFKHMASDYRKKVWWNSNIFKYSLIGIIIIIALILIYWAFSD